MEPGAPGTLAPLAGQRLALPIALPGQYPPTQAVLFGGGAVKLDHPTGAIAIQHRQWAAQDLYPIHFIHRHAGELPLAVRRTQGNTVQLQVNAAHTERRPGAKTAQGHPGILGVIGTTVGLHAGQPLQQLATVDAHPGLLAIHGQRRRPG